MNLNLPRSTPSPVRLEWWEMSVGRGEAFVPGSHVWRVGLGNPGLPDLGYRVSNYTSQFMALYLYMAMQGPSHCICLFPVYL